MFNKILVVYNEKLSKKHLNTLERARDMLKDVREKSKTEFSIIKSHELCESNFKDVNFIITIGGDGTFIRAARFVKSALMLGINSEPEYSEGALTSIDEKELDFLKKILQGNYKTIQRQRASIKRNGILLKELALNEIYVGCSSQFHTSRYIIRFKEICEEQRSSGVLVATGSGSRAWYKSAGGIPFSYDEKKLKFIVREPYNGDRLFKPKLIKGEILPNEKIEFEGKRYDGGIIAIDATSVYDFNAHDKIEIELSDCPLNVAVKAELD